MGKEGLDNPLRGEKKHTNTLKAFSAISGVRRGWGCSVQEGCRIMTGASTRKQGGKDDTEKLKEMVGTRTLALGRM